ncbi:MAG: ribonuclease P protein component [Bacteroidales bacterium]
MQTFNKEERLCSKKAIDFLFANGKTFYLNPFKVKWAYETFNNDFPVKILIVVPKRYFKKAHDRNKIKRRIREAYRKNKNILYEVLQDQQTKLIVAIIFTEKNELLYNLIEEKIILTLQRLKQLQDSKLSDKTNN